MVIRGSAREALEEAKNGKEGRLILVSAGIQVRRENIEELQAMLVVSESRRATIVEIEKALTSDLSSTGRLVLEYKLQNEQRQVPSIERENLEAEIKQKTKELEYLVEEKWNLEREIADLERDLS